MEEISSFLESNDYYQYTLFYLLSVVTGQALDEQTMKAKMKQRYGERIIITENL